MSNILQIKRGVKADLTALNSGELAFCVDTKDIYVGDGANNYRVVMHELASGKGDLLVATSSGTIGNIELGSDGYVLVVDSSEPTGLKWSTVSGSGGVSNHSSLSELDYASSGHTGFQPAGDYASTSDLTTVSGGLQTQIDTKSDTSHLHDDSYYTESEIDDMLVVLDYYTTGQVDTISGSLQTNIDNKADSSHNHNDLYYTEDEVDALIASVSGSGGSGMSDPMTTRGDIIYRNSSNETSRLSLGSSGEILKSDGTDLSWSSTKDSNAVSGINTQSGTSYTLVAGDVGKVIRCTNAGAVTLTVPPNSSVAISVNSVINICQAGAGTVTLSPGSGVTLNGNLDTANQYAYITIIKVDTDVWDVVGGVV